MSARRPPSPEEVVRSLEDIATSTSALELDGGLSAGEQAHVRRIVRTRTRAALVQARDEARVRRASGICAAAFALEAAGSIVIMTVTSGLAAAAVNSLAKAVVFATVCLLAAVNPRRYGQLLGLVIAGELVLVVGLLGALIAGETFVPADVASPWVGRGAAGGWIVVSLGLALAATWLIYVAGRLRHGLSRLSSLELATLVAVAELAVELGDGDGDDVARNADDYLASFASPRQQKVRHAILRLALRPVWSLQAPFPLLTASDRSEFVRSLAPGSATTRAFDVTRRLVYLAFYGTEEPRRSPRRKSESRLRRVPAGRLPSAVITTEIAIVGSGAAGSVLAAELVAAGHQVLVLERGRHVEPDEPGADELYRRASLLADGGIGAILDPARAVLASSCVGGNTNLGHGPLIRPDDEALERLLARVPVDQHELQWAFDMLPEGATEALPLPHGDERFATVERGLLDASVGFHRLADAPGPEWVNHSALDALLPSAQDAAGERLVVLSECTVRRLAIEAGKVRRLECRLTDGRELEVLADTVVVAAGVLESCALLRRSGIEGAGQGVSLYAGAELAGDFEEPFPSHAAAPASWRTDDGSLLRLEQRAAATAALRTPGDHVQHLSAMQRRDHQIALSALIGTAPGVASINDEGKLQLRIPPEETTRLRRSLAVAARSLLAAGAGFVVPAADRYARITAAGELGDARLWLTTAYPLGGNALSADPAAGVVDAEFRVHRHSNLFVCDASVLPRSLDVDPQLTVMALARLAARAVSRSARSAGQSRPARGC